MTVEDINSTVKHICKLVVRDRSATEATLLKRNIALRKLGEIYMSKTIHEDKALADLVRRMGLQTGLFDAAAAAPAASFSTSNPMGESGGDDDDDDDDAEGSRRTHTGIPADNTAATTKEGGANTAASKGRVLTKHEILSMIAAVPEYSTKELKRHISDFGGDSSSCIEKHDLAVMLNALLCEKLNNCVEDKDDETFD